METKADRSLISAVSRSLGFACNVVSSARGLSGGLALFWNGSVNLSVYNSSLNFFCL